MPEPTPPKSDRVGGDHKQGPNPGPGGEIEPGGLVPPYEGRTTGGEDDVRGGAESVARALPDEVVGGADQTASPASEEPAREEDLATEGPESPFGVGESQSTRGEDVGKGSSEPGRHDDPPQGAGDRPTGSSDKRDGTSINPDS